MESENTTDGILKIMHHMHSYVPGHSTETPTKLLSAGDLLTCERETNCIEQQRNASTPCERLEGLMPVIADFHTIANFYQVIYFMYDHRDGERAKKGSKCIVVEFLRAL